MTERERQALKLMERMSLVRVSQGHCYSSFGDRVEGPTIASLVTQGLASFNAFASPPTVSITEKGRKALGAREIAA